jgi:hypothetical protein
MEMKLREIRERVLGELNQATTTAALEQIRVSVLGKKGELTGLLRGMGKLPAEERPKVGQMVNEVRAALEGALEERLAALKASEKEAQKRTVLEGFQIQSPVVGQMAVAAEPAPDEIEPDVPSFVLQTNAERLSTALELSATLEKCGILGDIDSIYVENLNDIRFWYGERFLVKLGDAGLMAEKVALVDGAISTQLGSRETGILHVSSENGIKIEFEYRIFE